MADAVYLHYIWTLLGPGAVAHSCATPRAIFGICEEHMLVRHSGTLTLVRNQSIDLSYSSLIFPLKTSSLSGSSGCKRGYSASRPSSIWNVSAYALDGTDSGSTNRDAASILIGLIVDRDLASSMKKSLLLIKFSESVRGGPSLANRSDKILRSTRSTCSSLGPCQACRCSR